MKAANLSGLPIAVTICTCSLDRWAWIHVSGAEKAPRGTDYEREGSG